MRKILFIVLLVLMVLIFGFTIVKGIDVANINIFGYPQIRQRNEEIKDSPNVYYQSVGSTLQKATSGKFPLNFTHPLVKYFDGENDGLVGIDSFPWGEKFILEKNEKTKRGISHADMIDLNRENIDGFDVREFYINLVKELKEKGF